jgi:hypothetical protein
MAQDNRKFDAGTKNPSREETAEPSGKIPPVNEPRPASRNVIEIRSSAPRDPSTAYQPPNPHTVLPRANPTMKLLGAVVALILFVLVLLLIFQNWMTPGPRQPGAQKQGQTLEQKIP